MDPPVAADPESAELLDNESCLVCYEDLIRDIAVAYQAKEQGGWAVSKFCIDCIKQLLSSQFHRYIKSLETTTCAREQRALLDRGPPVNISDRIGFPLADTDEVYMLYELGSNKLLSPRLDGSVTGEERERLWEELKKFRFTNDSEE
ncbi:hypothetical protein BgAZ_403030 [Babesia gibsoni]|uniref:Uncharacterized protein n=1 Tax=Babesia gibsoni TaxID=33632 RepID=A0AAD8LIX4_BABGI|nr:hypothetical protein BgAZ_403030 [Babesia gibsoni]